MVENPVFLHYVLTLILLGAAGAAALVWLHARLSRRPGRPGSRRSERRWDAEEDEEPDDLHGERW